MSNLPFPWWDKTITLYNKYVDPTNRHITWYRTVIQNCFWKSVDGITYAGRYGVSALGMQVEIETIICRIPKDDRYMSKREWSALTDKSTNFTLANDDIIVLGEVSDIIDDYTPGQRSTDLVTRYKAFDECLQINAYSINEGANVPLEHYRIVGR